MHLPRLIHQIWVGPRMPQRFNRYAQRLRDLHPDWTYKLWTEAELAELNMHNRELYECAPDYQSARRVPRMRSNLARLEILEQFGGIYIDSDVVALRALDELLDEVHAFAAWSPNGSRHLTNAVMGAVPGHPFIAETVATAQISVQERSGKGSWEQTGPGHLTRVYHRIPHGVTIFPAEYFYPVGIDELRGRRNLVRRALKETDAYTVHEWASQRGQRSRKLAFGLARKFGLR